MRLQAGLKRANGEKVSKVAELQLMMILFQANHQYPKLMKLLQSYGSHSF
jgi:hypothetical protein